MTDKWKKKQLHLHTECKKCRVKLLEEIDSWIWDSELKGYICNECAAV